MSSFKIFDIVGSGLSAQSVRLNTAASNLANADSATAAPNTVYRAGHPVSEAVKPRAGAVGAPSPIDQASGTAVKVKGIMQSNALPTERYDPGNPLANEDGNVYAPNVNVIEEMTDMISASRAYQDNVEVLNTSKDLMLATLKLGS